MKSIIKIKNLEFKYSKSGKPILKDINLEIRENETFGIIGPTGAGKSTLILQFNGILRGQGLVEIDGLQVNKDNLKKIRERVGIVFQNPDNQLFCPTVYEDVAFGLVQRGDKEEEIAFKVKNIFKTFELDDYSQLTSHHLSFGEKKRVSIASIMVMKPRIICFDEPFANLDYRSVYNIIDEINKMDITKVIVSQDILLTLAICDRIAILNNGKIHCVDKPKEIINKHRLLLKNNSMDYEPYLKLINRFI